MKLEIRYNKKTTKSTSTWRVNNTLLNKEWTIEEIRRYKKKNLDISENGYTYTHIPYMLVYTYMGCSKDSSKREI